MKTFKQLVDEAKSRGFDEFYAINFAKGYIEGCSIAAENIALNCIKLGSPPLKDIAEICHLPLQRVQELAASLHS